MRYKLYLFFISISLFIHHIASSAVIVPQTSLQMGDNIIAYCLAKALSNKYHMPLRMVDFKHSDLFVFSSSLERISQENLWKKPNYIVKRDIDLIKNKDKDVYLLVNINTWVDSIDEDALNEIKKDIQLQHIPHVPPLPENILTVAVHIRKGNGGGEVLDGDAASLQYFSYDPSLVKHFLGRFNLIFDPDNTQRPNYEIQASTQWDELFKQSCQDVSIALQKKIDNEASLAEKRKTETLNVKAKPPTDTIWLTRFLPNQFYVDHIKMLSDYLEGKPLFVQIFTDDKNPYALLKDIEAAVDRPNITFHFANYRDLPYTKQMQNDLYVMSKCDILIRPQSFFSRTAELMGSHKMVIYPLECKWEGGKLIPRRVVIKSNLSKT